jgi:hypothetical protein
MKRAVLAVLVIALLSSAAGAVPAADPATSPDAVGRECYAAVGSLLHSSGGKLTPEVRKAYLDWAEKSVLQQLAQAGASVPAGCLDEVRHDDTLRDAVFGSVFPPDPSILQNWAQLQGQFAPDLAAEYRSLLLAISISRRVKGVETAAQRSAIGRDYQPEFWAVESLDAPGSDVEKRFVAGVAEFMRRNQVSAENLYKDPSGQEQLKAYLKQIGLPSNWVASVGKSVPFGQRLKAALVAAGQRPAHRDPKPAPVDWIRHLIEISSAHPASTPTVDGKPLSWPLFPIDSAPWPLLMPLAHRVPLSEAAYIWEAFLGEHGPDRFHTYGPFRGGEDVIANSLGPSRWFWDAWPDRIVHGGVCVDLSIGTCDFYSALGKPAMWAGQPGHSNLITFRYADGAWICDVEQAFAGGPDVTYAQWYFDEEPGMRYREMFNWPGAEYQLGLALAMNAGLKSYVDTRLAATIFRAMPAEDKSTLGMALLHDSLLLNPYNPEIWYRLADLTTDETQQIALVQAAMKSNPGILSPGAAGAPEQHGVTSDQYWRTLAEFTAHYAIAEHPTPKAEQEMRRAYEFIKTVPGMPPEELENYVEKFLEEHAADPEAGALDYDRGQALQGSIYGFIRMGQRYRDGDGVAQDEAKALDCFARAALQGDRPASLLMADLSPAIPGDQIAVTASSQFSQDQSPQNLVNGAGMVGAMHDNQYAACTMWHTVSNPRSRPPAVGLPASPAWVRFDFARPMKVASIQIWNHNQDRYTNRGFRSTRIYGSADGATWFALTSPAVVVVPQASGLPGATPVIAGNVAADRPLTSVTIAADAEDGNYGGDCYGLSAVHFVIRHLPPVVLGTTIKVTASTIYSGQQTPLHLVDGEGMVGAFHDNANQAETMWHTQNSPASQPPAAGLPPSPAWVRFDFARPKRLDKILIWNLNQRELSNRGFRTTHIYGTSDGATWKPLTSSETVVLPRATGLPMYEPASVSLDVPNRRITSVIIAADATDGNYGGNVYGLSAVRFVLAH